MPQTITANELKTKGISIINKNIVDGSEIIITVRGKSRFVVLPIEKYNNYREYELEVALNESKKDLKEGRYIKESVSKHIKRITHG
jgi:prevent-host-death family protein